MQSTKLTYVSDAYQKTVTTTVLEVIPQGNQIGVILEETVLYPTGGGQLCDRGTIVGKNGSLEVKDVRYNNGAPIHTGPLTGTIEVGDEVVVTIDWKRRYQHMQQHTAGHILDEAIKELYQGVKGIDGMHGISNKYYVQFDAKIAEADKGVIQAKIDEIIKADGPITSRMVTKDQIDKEGIELPFKLPENKPLRLVRFGDRKPVPDGGTQLKSTGESWPISITHMVSENNQTTIHYQVMIPTAKAVRPTAETLSLDAFKTKIDEVKKEFITGSHTSDSYIEYLGKKGKVNQVAVYVRGLAPEDKVEGGKELNELKDYIQNELGKQTDLASNSSTWLDVTKPGKKPQMGHLHPVSQAIEEIQSIFEGIGFTRVRYPEIDWDYYVFEALNMPKNHPARDEWETFFMDAPHHPEKGQMVLTTHTSNGQVREMERVGKPPIRMLNIGKTYRRQQDVTHTAMFHQFEGLVIDKGITIQHLKGTLDYFAKKFYGPTAKSRIRPFMFKFTEPSFEIDFSCVHCEGKGCRFCKSGWHEVGGAGMVHPNVLKYGGIDPDMYTGFAFGWGVERVYTLKPGLNLDDIRPLYGNNLDFLEQF